MEELQKMAEELKNSKATGSYKKLPVNENLRANVIAFEAIKFAQNEDGKWFPEMVLPVADTATGKAYQSSGFAISAKAEVTQGDQSLGVFGLPVWGDLNFEFLIPSEGAKPQIHQPKAPNKSTSNKKPNKSTSNKKPIPSE